MGFLGTLKNLLGADAEAEPSAATGRMANKVEIEGLVFNACVGMVAGALSVCEIKTFLEDEEVKKSEHYLWNVAPNPNQTATEFIHDLTAKLFYNNEVIIFEKNKSLYVASDFAKEEKGLSVKFSDVNYGGEKIPVSAKNVIYIRLANKNVKKIASALMGKYAELVAYGMNSFKGEAGMKGIVKSENAAQGTKEEQKVRNEKLKKGFESLWSSPSSVMLLSKGYEYTQLNNATPAQNSGEIRKLINDAADYMATAFNIPSTLLTGEVENTANAIDQFLTFCIDPLAGLIEKAINKNRYSEEDYLSGSRVVIDTKAVKHIDLLSVSTAIDKLISSGAFSINDIRKVVGEKEIDEDFADAHFITKNYTLATDYLTELAQ
jgi:HK97 family phage portal protein